ncbi:MAG: recombination protein O N-terminal domain-containing protein [Candidatus Pacebacteria bacterium]|nr:recombination protein O N-terminal domain-containing protein [Candidatus Paceibacterota bacterium]
MYAIHTTPGFIVSSRPSGEAGKLLSIFTKDLGLIRATAQGIRFEKSKLRPFIQDYSLGVFSFVSGKEFWRLTNAQELKVQDTSLLAQTGDKLQEVKLADQNQELIARIALLLNRLLQGEEPHPELFIALDSLFDFINSWPTLGSEAFKTLESLIVTRILHRLGYVASISALKEDIESDAISLDRLTLLGQQRTLMNQHINRALRESHL